MDVVLMICFFLSVDSKQLIVEHFKRPVKKRMKLLSLNMSLSYLANKKLEFRRVESLLANEKTGIRWVCKPVPFYKNNLSCSLISYLNIPRPLTLHTR